MKTPRLNFLASAASLCLAGGLLPLPAQAAIITLTGTNFDVQYDDTKLGLFGAPTLFGNNLIFTPNSFSVESKGSGPSGLQTNNSTVNGLILIAKNGYQFTGFAVYEFGDYKLTGAASTVNVQGQLRAFDYADPIFTQTSSRINPFAPLDVVDSALHDWSAGAAIGSLAWVLGATQVGLTIENQLSAVTTADAGTNDAFIEKKFVGGAVTLTVNPVPLPASALLLLSGLLLGGAGMARSRCGRERAAI